MNILFTSVGRRAATIRCFQESLKGQCRIFGANSTPGTTGLISADKSFVLPRADQSDYLDALLKVCRENGVEAIFSLHDLETYVLSMHKKALMKEGIRFIGPSDPMGRLCLDKYEFYRWALRKKIRVPRTFLRLQDAVKALGKKQIEFPLILKPRYGFGSRGIYVAHNRQELKAAYLLAKRFDYQSSVLHLDKVHGKGKIIIQEYVHGVEYSVEIINDLSGRYLGTFIKRKLEMGGVEADAVVTEQHPQMMDFSKKLSRLLGVAGVVDLDLFLTDQGKIILIEANPRLGAGYPFSHQAGADVPKIFMALINRKKVDPRWFKIKQGMVMFRDITVLTKRRHDRRSFGAC